MFWQSNGFLHFYLSDFLDVTLNLSNGKYYPFRKPNNEPVYINVKSNHPPTILRHLPAAINRRISNLSGNEEEFQKTSGPYNATLSANGCMSILRKEQQGEKINSNRKRKRTRKFIWLKPPFSQNVMTNVAKIFLLLANKHLVYSQPRPAQDLQPQHPKKLLLHDEYRKHNKGAQSKTSSHPTESNETRSCICRKPEICPPRRPMPNRHLSLQSHGKR